MAALEARVAQLEKMLQEVLTASSTTVEATAPPAAEKPKGQPTSTYKFGGYLKFDGMFSDYSGGDLAPSSAGTQFYIPGTIPVGGSPSEGPDADFQAQESRIYFKSDHDLGNGDKVSTHLEFDFFLSPGGNERISNSWAPRTRHAFVKYNNWLFGQTWTTFQDVGALPENLDFVGPAESTVFGRQAMVRYTTGNWEFAVENPETTVTPLGGGGRIVTDDGTMPDLVARYTHTFDNGYIKAATLVRQLNYKTAGVDTDEMSYGLSLSGKIMFGVDDFRWMATTGSGLGRYLGLNTANGGVLDANNELQAIDSWAAFASYRHFWTDDWRSSFTVGYLSVDNDTSLTGTGVTEEVNSFHINLLYSPLPKMTVGGELLFADRTIESGASGDMTRLILSAKYVF